MSNLHECDEFVQFVTQKLDEERIYQDAGLFSKLHRYSGSPDGEQAVDIIMDRMAEYGIPAVRESYDIYRSLPLEATLTVTQGKVIKEYKLTPFVYSGETQNLTAKIVFDSYCTKERVDQIEQAQRCKDFAGNIVFTYDASFDFACLAKKYKAAAILTAWPLNIPHHGSIGRVWGTPEVFDLEYRYPYLPYAELLKKDGDELKALLDSGDVTGTLTVQMDNSILKSSMPIATIQGKREEFVLVSGHYDSWYEGMTDNGIANVAMIDMARALKEAQDKLERTVVFAWWSGHSDGRYAGSTWYLDNHFKEMKEKCVAHINMDICGCMGSDLVAFNTSTLEGPAFAKEFLEVFNDSQPEEPKPMARFADQTFWGANVPFAIMPRFGVKNPGGRPFYWWHTPEDGLDKVDKKVMMRDALVIAKLACIFANINPLPVDFDSYITMIVGYLKGLQSDLSVDFNLDPVFPALDKMRKTLKKLEEAMKGREQTDGVILKAAGELTRITYTYSSAYHQDEAVDYGIFPMLSQARHKTAANTTPDYYLALRTSFVRQVNRVVGQLDYAMEAVEHQLLLWEKE